MVIGLRIFSIFVALVGIAYALSPGTAISDWQDGLYGSAIGTFTGRYMAWLVIAIYSWIYAGKYQNKNPKPPAEGTGEGS